MPRVARPKGWNDLSPSQQEAWKKKNFRNPPSVSEKAIQKLRDGGTKAYNVKKYSGTKNAVMREAMNRFYGRGWDKGAASKPKPKTPTAPRGAQLPNDPYKGRVNPRANKTTKPKPKNVPVTSVTPRQTVKDTSRKQKDRTFDLVANLALMAAGGGATSAAIKAAQKGVSAMKATKAFKMDAAVRQSIATSKASRGVKAAATRKYNKATTAATKNQGRGLITGSEAAQLSRDALYARATTVAGKGMKKATKPKPAAPKGRKPSTKKK